MTMSTDREHVHLDNSTGRFERTGGPHFPKPLITDEQTAALKDTFVKLGKSLSGALRVSAQCRICCGWIAYGESYHDHAKANHPWWLRLREWIEQKVTR